MGTVVTLVFCLYITHRHAHMHTVRETENTDVATEWAATNGQITDLGASPTADHSTWQKKSQGRSH